LFNKKNDLYSVYYSINTYTFIFFLFINRSYSIMSSDSLVIKDNINNEQQYCKGCERYFSPNSFTNNRKSYRTCNACRIQNKAVYQRKLIQKQQNNAYSDDQMPTEFHNFDDFIVHIFDLFESITITDNEREQENINPEFKVSYTVNITSLKGNSKERADYIVKTISEVDEYTWV